MKSTPVKITYKPLRLDRLKIYVYSDASHKIRSQEISQGGFVIFIADDSGTCNIVKWQSKKLSRVCVSTLGAETCAMLDAVETAYFVKVLLQDMIQPEKPIDVINLCDNKSVVSNLETSNTVSDYRIRVDICRVRQMLGNGELKKVQWVGTEFQLADCLTKAGNNGGNLLQAIRSNTLPRLY